MRPILQFVGSGAVGGGTTVVLALSHGLAGRGIPVVVASQRGSYLIDAARDRGLATLELDLDRRANTPALTVRLAHAIRELKPSMLHAHGARAALPAALIPAALRVPLVYTVHGFHFPSKAAGVRQLARLAERFCIRQAVATVFVSHHDQALAISDGVMSVRSRQTVIHNGSECMAAGEIGAAPAFDLVFLGRLHPQKNPLALADILLALRPLEPRLAIIGSGECEAALRERLMHTGTAHQAQFLGVRPSSEALALLARSRALVLPSFFEGLPMAVIEAMHLGVPVVASRVGGVGELIDDGRTGFLVQPEDIPAFADRLRRLLLDEPARKAMGQAAQSRARLAFSIEHNVDRHLALYDHIVRRSRGIDAALVSNEQWHA